ncbi:MAG: groS [Parcubacteria group bacterium]|nr:groS [Parcubacteria group bacterium]
MAPKTTKVLSIQPLSDRVVVKPISVEEVSASGIIIPDTVKKEKAERGTVVATGPGRYDDGALVPMTVKKGDEVLFEQSYRDPIEIDGQEYYIFSEASILAIIPAK